MGEQSALLESKMYNFSSGRRRAGTTDCPIGNRIFSRTGTASWADEFCSTASRLLNSLSLPLAAEFTATIPQAAELVGTARYVLDTALLISTDMNMACSTLLPQASSPAVQS
ncbi:hypothetical protein OIU74_012623 [Salix koriyanagi]|uniref:Uncharacterized protein n=1 Tax=Salix koriyanagi TaxID=2511006 RepID=A0A9Q0T4Q7_9ROSI|nr:hypothetical protein OIU74_012623 [Salix koriyanagi]